MAKVDINKILKLRMEGLTYAQIAERLDTTENYIKNCVYRASHPQGKKKKTRQFVYGETQDLIAQYSSSIADQHSKLAGAMKEENAGRAKAANLHVLTCVRLGHQVDPDNINSLYAAFETYIRLCVESDFPMTVATACIALGISQTTLYTWASGKNRADNPDYKTFAESVKYAVQAGIETCMVTGLINPIVGIWWEKSHFGMIEQQKQEAPKEDPLGEKKSAEEIMEQYSGVDLPD